jgi:hypothetical protein
MRLMSAALFLTVLGFLLSTSTTLAADLGPDRGLQHRSIQKADRRGHLPNRWQDMDDRSDRTGIPRRSIGI